MDDPRPPAPDDDPGTPEPIPWGQRFYDRPFVLLFLGILIMAICFTGWGLIEITSLTPSPLP